MPKLYYGMIDACTLSAQMKVGDHDGNEVKVIVDSCDETIEIKVGSLVYKLSEFYSDGGLDIHVSPAE